MAIENNFSEEVASVRPALKFIYSIFVPIIILSVVAVLEEGVTSIEGFLGILFFVASIPFIFLYYPNKYISIKKGGILHKEAIGVGGWVAWGREKRTHWRDIDEINGIFGFLPPKWVHVNGEYSIETKGKFEGRSRKEDTIQLPMSPFPWFMSGIADEAISYICQRVSSEKIRPEVIQYLKRRGLYDPERHPKPEECKGGR